MKFRIPEFQKYGRTDRARARGMVAALCILLAGSFGCAGIDLAGAQRTAAAVACEACKLAGGSPEDLGAKSAEALRLLALAVAQQAIQAGANRSAVEALLRSLDATAGAQREAFEALARLLAEERQKALQTQPVSP